MYKKCKKYIKIWKSCHHHHHHIALVARISLTLSRHSSLSFIALGRSSGQHPVSSHSCWMYVRAGRPAFARPCVGVHKSTSLMSSSLLLQQCPACLVRLTWIVFVIGGRWPYSWCLVGCCCQKLYNKKSWLFMTRKNPHSPDDGSAEPKRYSVDWLCFSINPYFLFGLLIVNFSSQIVGLLSIIFFHIYIYSN